nr:RNA-directed DNA polymerase, eukaryota, reverse transcriptase zinc-binding domain protein [Tanacetum cinerariifolium]
MGFCKIVIGNGSTTRFWHDIWYGDICFKEKFKRLFNLELQKDANVASKLQASNVSSSFRRPPRSSIENSQFIELGQILSSIFLSSVSDRWSWTLHGLSDFSVKSAREEIDKHVLVVSPSQTRWSKVKIDDPNITTEDYTRLEEEKSHRRGKVYNWENATYGKIWDNEDVHDLEFVETEFTAIVFNSTLTSEAALSCEPTVSSLNDNEIDFRILFDESDDENYTVVYDKNLFSYKIISVNDLKTDSENDNDKVSMPSVLLPEPTVSCLNDLDFLKDFENEFPAIVYNDALTSKFDFSTEPTLSP